MQIILSDFMSLDGVVQAPGGRREDTDGGKYVASRTLTQDDLTWSGSTLLPADDAIGAVRELRAQNGNGKRLFPDDGRARPLELVSTTTAQTGVLICTYRPVSR